ncbi:tyrosine recombinase XerC [Acuticoccus sp. M5D2P5]|uniref:tyrosine recombinase XerC n=1 Tax=Acuticoccus kalidii TaxID=2910977 RepID=UPI001F3E375D|nr:tyrosine recombinase XerC [Acuticoccus kalidii]MCF3932234.1 tyrosine recombinase XerC [Acuticoccus kalidii]
MASTASSPTCLLPAAPTLLAARKAWLDMLADERGLSDHTIDAYERDTRQFLIFLAQHWGGPAELADLDGLKPMDLRAFLAQRRREGAGPASLARILAGVRTMLGHFERHHGINAAAARAVSAPSKPRGLPRPVPVEAATTMLTGNGTSWTEMRDVAVLSLLYGAGLRVGEAVGLDCIDLAPPIEILRVRGKGGKERIVPILPTVAEACDRYRALAPFALVDGPFFRGEKGGRLSARIVQRVVANWRAALGLPDTATPHALRHAFASHILAHGGDLRAIQELLGHSSLSTTQVYTAVDDRRLLEAWRDSHPRAVRP